MLSNIPLQMLYILRIYSLIALIMPVKYKRRPMHAN